MKKLTEKEVDLLPDNIKEKVVAPIENFYGEPYVFSFGDKYYFGLWSHSSQEVAEVSKEFYDVFVKEFTQ